MRDHGCGGMKRTLRWMLWISQLMFSAAFAQDTQAPTTPTGFTAVAISSTTVVVNWLASTDNVAVTGYQIERCQGNGCNSSFTQTNASSPGWANSGLTPGTTYGYRVRARDAVPNYNPGRTSGRETADAAGETQAPHTPNGL